MLIVGMGALTRADGAAILDCARRIAESTGMIRDSWNGFNVLHTAAARVGGLDLGFVPACGGRDVRGILDDAEAGEIDFLYLLGADELDTSRLGSAFVVYQGHHGDAGAHRADVILPGAAYTEKDATYVNLEGRAQGAWFACKLPGEAREDWAILRALSETLGRTLPVNSLADVRRRLIEANAVFATPDKIVKSAWTSFGAPGLIDDTPFEPAIENFHLTNPICRASVTMAQCVEAFTRDVGMKTGTYG
jgi:NADH-quinone oxidoreductase subunit G